MTSQNELDVKARGGTELLGERLEKLVNPELLKDFQIIRSRFRGFDESKKYHVFWEHDLASDPESVTVFEDEKILQRLDAIVFLTYWQKNEFLRTFPKLPAEKCVIIRNGIDPIDISQKTRFANPRMDDKIHLIYTPTPHRGLELLAPVFHALTQEFPGKLHLDVYSSFKLYGWEDRDKPYQNLFEQIKSHPDMTYHGTVSNDEIRKALLGSDIFVYPSIWQETSCLCLIEAMSAGLVCICSDLAAIPETSGGLICLYPYMPNPNYHLQTFYNICKDTIRQYINNPGYFASLTEFTKLYSDLLHNTELMGRNWTAILESIKVRS